MKRLFMALVLLGLTGGGCGQKETPAPASKSAPVAPPAMPALSSSPEAPPPPGTAPAAPAAPAQAQIPTFEGKDEAERLTKALHAYYDRSGAAAPLITSLEDLVKAGFLKSVPVPPAGKKYVVDTKYPFQVHLENK